MRVRPFDLITLFPWCILKIYFSLWLETQKLVRLWLILFSSAPELHDLMSIVNLLVPWPTCSEFKVTCGYLMFPRNLLRETCCLLLCL